MTPIQAAKPARCFIGQRLDCPSQKLAAAKPVLSPCRCWPNLNARRVVQALVLCPTRELADQVTTEIRRLARAEDNIKVVTLCGGVPLRGQLATLEHGAHIVVGTPGRVMDHLGARQPATRSFGHAGAGRGRPDARYGLLRRHRHCGASVLPKTRQTLLFSATYPEGIAKLANQFMREPLTVKVEAQHAGASTNSAGTKSKTASGCTPSVCC